MDLAFVGSETDWAELSPWFRFSSENRVVGILSDDRSQDWHHWPEGIRPLHDFEMVLADPEIDGLILAGNLGRRPEIVRRSAQTERFLVCAHPADLGAVFYHEVAMIALESRAILVPFLPARCHSAWLALQSLCHTERKLGAIRSVCIERGAPYSDKQLIAGSYAEAADLLTGLLGDVRQVTATGDLAHRRLMVQHEIGDNVQGEIRLDATQPDRQWQVRVVGERGRAELLLEQGWIDSGWLRCTVGDELQEDLIPHSNFDLIDLVTSQHQGSSRFPSWSEATQLAELADNVALSLQRLRTVEVFHEKRDELASFKGRMTTCGCGLIWTTLFGIMSFAAARGLGIPWLEWVPYLLISLLVLFLMAQGLRWIFPSDSGADA